MIPTKRFALLLSAAAACTIVWSIPADAQIIYPLPPYRYAMNPDSSIHVEMTPRDAEVYVDGYYAGIVDDFDGAFQRLRVEPGPHEIIVYHEGFRPFRQSVYLMPGKTFTIKQRMEPLAPGEAGAPRPVPVISPGGAQAPFPLPRDGRRAPPVNLPPPNVPPAGNPPQLEQNGTGRLTIQLQPAGADVLIDGQPWPAAQGQNTVVVDLSEGRHVVQVRKQGYVGYLTEIEVRRGETTTVNVSLRTQP